MRRAGPILPTGEPEATGAGHGAGARFLFRLRSRTGSRSAGAPDRRRWAVPGLEVRSSRAGPPPAASGPRRRAAGP